ncbi:MAG: type I restriction enzyme HsdR N-terminal domain-containing protein [Kiritimatiellae bacterium]|nr:type I restriction enzyme HsdR N-terminal domain-containing protein [Kiritimatiellia bacterium]
MRSDFYTVSRETWLFAGTATESDGKRTQPEEDVRQWCLHELLRAYGVLIGNLQVERPVRVGTRTHRADIVMLQDNRPYIVIECKSRRTRKHDEAMKQAISYATAADMNAEFAVYTNGDVWWVRRRVKDQWVPVPDLPTFRDGAPTTDWQDILLAVDRAGPVLYWLDETVPVKQAAEYFGALQRFFHASNEITADTDHKLLWSAGHVLRVLDDVNRHPNYTGGKLSHACDGLNKYWQARGIEPSFGGDDLWEMAHHAWADLSCHMEGARDVPALDHQAIRVILALLDYLNRMKGRRVKYRAIESSIQTEVRAYIDLALKLRFNAQLPDPQDKILVQDVRDFCRPLWSEYLKERNGGPWTGRRK